ncbi:MAG: DinB family protein [Bacteroidota bacterium]
MGANKHIIELVRFNLWANKRLVAWLKANDEVLIIRESPSSFPSIIKTVNHILEGEMAYYEILTGTLGKSPKPDSIQDSYANLLEQSTAFVSYTEGQPHFNELREIDSKYLRGRFPQHELIQHCMNHSTYHRGQLVTLGHQLGLTKAPSTDMLFYFSKKVGR